MTSLLTTKERERLEKVRQLLSENKSPYSKDNREDGKLEVATSNHRRVIREVPLSVRLANWYNKEEPVNHGGRIVKRFKNLGTSDPMYTGLRCMRCDKPIEQVTSTLGKMLTGYIKKEVIQHVEVLYNVFADVSRIIYIPKLTKGRVCSECVEHLSQIIIEDSGHM